MPTIANRDAIGGRVRRALQLLAEDVGIDLGVARGAPAEDRHERLRQRIVPVDDGGRGVEEQRPADLEPRERLVDDAQPSVSIGG